MWYNIGTCKTDSSRWVRLRNSSAPRETLRRWEETGEWLPARKTHPACGGDSLSQPQQEQDVQEYSRISKMKQA